MKMTKKYCNGCANNFYNGNNNLGVKECWSFNDAVMIKRVSIGHWENLPYKNKTPKLMPNCFHERGNNRNHYINPDKIDSQGHLR